MYILFFLLYLLYRIDFGVDYFRGIFVYFEMYRNMYNIV